MNKLSNDIIERLAVQAVKSEVTKPPYCLKAEIPEGDKGISFDGEIIVFNDSSHTTSSFNGSIPVQVKGTQVKFFSDNKRTFSLQLAHFENYYKKEGVIIFVVELREERSKIFYKQLLPLELSHIINECEQKEKKSHRIELRSLKGTDMQRICQAFLKEQLHQPLVLIEDGETLLGEEHQKYIFRSLTFNPSSMKFDELFEHDFFMYALEKNLHIPISMGRVSSITSSSEMDVNIDGFNQKFSVSTTFNSGSLTITFENVLKMVLDGNDLKISNCQFHSLSSQLKVIPLLSSLIERKKITLPIGDIQITDYSEKSIRFIDEMKEHILFIEDLKKAFLYFSINPDTIFSKNEEGMNLNVGLSFLVRASKHGDISDFKKRLSTMKNSCLINLLVGDQTIICFLNDDKLKNFFSKDQINIKAILGYNTPDQCDYSIYVQLNDDSLSKGINLDFPAIKESFQTYDPFVNELASSTTTNFCLRCINAYDKSNRRELLLLAKYILSMHPSIETDDFNYINFLQINKRLNGSLTAEEEDKLMSLKSAPSADILKQFGACILLESKIEAKRLYSKLDNETLETIATMPIMKLYGEL
ncbi:DUF4365 domain-containing protein [Paenibacillus apis]|uniref:DUF4365 domain-containing protein n=1 Tax=Paenibacillus apis TaxID=1792174 RepID=A0A919Y4I8_9BACL|nr:DUF4365 domain-containing protein [Paenibacillus apis]GIO42228.1 hypothetical protein J41TS4_19860 [Paenibacillus apis]